MRADALPPLVVRADATAEIGGGHLMRCLALAQAWREAGGTAAFVGRYDGDFPDVLAAAGMPASPITAPHPDPSDVAQTSDRIRAVIGHLPPVVVVDGYHFDAGYQQSICSAHDVRVLRVDDGETTPRIAAHILLNQNLHAAHIPFDCNPDVVVLAGTRYALLRKEFRGPARGDGVPGSARRVLAMLGGSDPAGASAVVLRAFERLSDLDLRLDLVVGPGNPRARELAALARPLGARARVYRSPSSMAALMAESDLAVAAAGSTAWELAALGVPMVLTSTARNQVPIARELDRRGAAVDLGSVEGLTADRVAEAVRSLVGDGHRRGQLGSRARQLVDGCGADRVVAICRVLSGTGPFEWSIRPMSADDVWQVWRVANDPGVRAQSFSTQPIPVPDHEKWFGAQLADTGVRWFAADLAGVVVGHARYFRRSEGAAEVHFAVAAPFRGRGVAAGLLSRTFAAACVDLRVQTIYGLVLQENTASIRAFLNAGYVRGAPTTRGGRACDLFERRLA